MQETRTRQREETNIVVTKNKHIHHVIKQPKISYPCSLAELNKKYLISSAQMFHSHPLLVIHICLKHSSANPHNVALQTQHSV